MEQYERLFHRYPALDGLRGSVMEAYLLLRGCYSRGGKLLIVGNGGSCADAGHIVGELMKGFYLKRPFPEEKRAVIAAQTESLLPGTAELLQQALPAIDLTQHGALSTAVQNDLEPLLTAAQQVAGYGKPGDVVLGISTSGNAKNVALAVGVAKALGLSTIGLTGGSGGQLKELCDCAIIAPAHTPADVQEYHLPIYHTLCAMLEEKFFGKTEK
ncbi:MAG: SIS domain-containing protein [Lachnospiraceae bacterium]